MKAVRRVSTGASPCSTGPTSTPIRSSRSSSSSASSARATGSSRSSTGATTTTASRAAGVRAQPAAVRRRQDPARGAQLRLRLVARARRLGAAGLRLRRRHRPVVRGHLPLERRQGRDGDRRAARASEVKELMESVDLDRGSDAHGRPRGDDRDGPGRRRCSRSHSTSSTRYRLLNGLDDIGLTLQHEDAITRTRARGNAYPDRATTTCDKCHKAGRRRGRAVAVTHVAVLRATASGPRSRPRRSGCSTRSGSSTAAHPFGGNAILEQGTPLPDETLAACRAADAVLLAAVGLPELEGKPVRPEQGLLGAAQGARRLREPSPGSRRRHRHDHRARARRRPLLRRQGHPRRRHLVRHVRVLPARGRADRTARLRDRPGSRRPADLGRQGQRDAHLAAVARRRHRDGSGAVPRRARSTTHSSTRSR